MSFKPCKAYHDLWYHDTGDHYDYVATYMDHILAFSKDPMSIITEIQTDYVLKDIGTSEYYLGGNFHTTQSASIAEVNDDVKEQHLSSLWLKEYITTAFSAETYIKNSLERLENMIGKTFPTFNTPMAEGAHPEIVDSPILDAMDHAKYRSLVGCANWLLTLGRFDIAYATNSFSRFNMQPRQGHLNGMVRVFGYLKKFPKGKIMIDPTYPDHASF